MAVEDKNLKPYRIVVLAIGLVVIWQTITSLTGVPHYILPGPVPVLKALVTHFQVLAVHTGITLTEIVLGLIIGTVLGCLSALIMMISPALKRWLLPVLVISQAIPVFALAPILVLWLGYGMASKVAMAVVIIFFPVCSSFYHGMRRTDSELLDLAWIMGGRPSAIFRLLIIPSAMPAFGGGLRVAAAVSPIGAVVGEWVGASGGLGYYMLHANARMQIDRMFAALFLLAVISVGLYFLVDGLLTRLIYWEKPRGLTNE